MNRTRWESIVASAIESGGFDCQGGTLWTQLLAAGEIEMPKVETKSQCEVPLPSAAEVSLIEG